MSDIFLYDTMKIFVSQYSWRSPDEDNVTIISRTEMSRNNYFYPELVNSRLKVEQVDVPFDQYDYPLSVDLMTLLNYYNMLFCLTNSPELLPPFGEQDYFNACLCDRCVLTFLRGFCCKLLLVELIPIPTYHLSYVFICVHICISIC